jgi:hypothetical protein
MKKYIFLDISTDAITQLIQLMSNFFSEIKTFNQDDLNIFFGKHNMGKKFSLVILRVVQKIIEGIEKSKIIESKISTDKIEFVWKRSEK